MSAGRRLPPSDDSALKAKCPDPDMVPKAPSSGFRFPLPLPLPTSDFHFPLPTSAFPLPTSVTGFSVLGPHSSAPLPTSAFRFPPSWLPPSSLSHTASHPPSSPISPVSSNYSIDCQPISISKRCICKRVPNALCLPCHSCILNVILLYYF